MLLVAGTTILAFLALHPAGSPLHLWMAWAPLLLHVLHGGRRDLTLLCVASPLMALTPWIATAVSAYTGLPWMLALGVQLLAVLASAIPLTAIFLAAPRLQRDHGAAWPWVWAALFAGGTWLIDRVAVFPLSFGASQLDIRPIAQVLSLAGEPGVCFLLALVNGTLAHLVHRRKGLWLGCSTLCLMICVVWWGHRRVASFHGNAIPTTRVAMVQTDLDPSITSTAPGTVLESFQAWTRTLQPGDADLIVWPESVLPTARMPKALQKVQALAERLDADLIVGGSRAQDRQLHGSAFLVHDGQTSRRDKALLMPFAETLPWSPWQPAGLLTAGDDDPVLTGRHRYGVAICYEHMDALFARPFADADILVALSNESWFGHTAMRTFARAAAARAIELGRPMVRVGFSGISMVVDPVGVVQHRTRPGEAGVTMATVALSSVDTPFRRGGAWFGLACLLWVALVQGRQRTS